MSEAPIGERDGPVLIYVAVAADDDPPQTVVGVRLSLDGDLRTDLESGRVSRRQGEGAPGGPMVGLRGAVGPVSRVSGRGRDPESQAAICGADVGDDGGVAAQVARAVLTWIVRAECAVAYAWLAGTR